MWYFFSFRGRKEVERAIDCPFSRVLVFGVTEERARNGLPLWIYVGHAVNQAEIEILVGMAMTKKEYARCRQFVVYDKEEIRRGLQISDQEEHAKEN